MTLSIIIIALLLVLLYLTVKKHNEIRSPVCLTSNEKTDEKPVSSSKVGEDSNVKFISIDSDQAASEEVLNIDTVTTMAAYDKNEEKTKVFLTSGKTIVVNEKLESLVERINAAR